MPVTHELVNPVNINELRPDTPAQQAFGQQNMQACMPASCQTLTAPLGGKIIKILAEPNQNVTTNQPLVIIESMKMENEICAPHNAIVKTLHIHTGDLVKVGQVLIVFEKKGDHNATTKDEHEQEETTYRGSC